MTNSAILDRIVINPSICHGKPVLRNTRHMVEGILEYMAGGDTIEELLETFPDLEKEDILACVAFAATLMNSHHKVEPVA